MLKLSRRIGETIRINNDISLTLTSLQGDQVVLGIKAPNSASIHHEEMIHSINTDEHSSDGFLGRQLDLFEDVAA